MIQQLSTSLHGRRLHDTIVPDPAAGDEIIITVPPGVVWEFNSLHFLLVAGVGGGNRRMSLGFNAGTAPCQLGFCHDTQAATTSNVYHFIAGYHEYFDFSAVNETYQAIPRGILLAPGNSWQTLMVSRQAGDQYSNIAFSYYETLTP